MVVSHWGIRHWLLVANLANAAIVAGAIAVPLMRWAGWAWVADPIFSAYSLVCEQRPERSFYLGGYQMAIDQRMTAIYGSSLLAGLAFIPLRGRLHPISWRTFVLLCLPIAMDGFTQLFGWRYSTWQLRTATGTLFGLGTAWLAYPHFSYAFAQLQEAVDARSHIARRADTGSKAGGS